MINCTVLFFKYLRRPSAVVMKGAYVDGRFIAFVGVGAKYSTNEYGNRVVTFSNCSDEYYKSNIYKRIWSIKSLRYWRKLLGSGVKCIQVVNGEHKRVSG